MAGGGYEHERKKSAIVWGIHAGQTGDADPIFLKKNQVALGWVAMGDLSLLKPNRDVFKEELQKVYPEKKPGYFPNAAGQLIRFVHEMKVGDLIIYPSKIDRHVHIGEISGPYQYLGKNADGYPHRRLVKWLKDFPRTKFSQGALYEIGSAMSFFKVESHAEEFLSTLVGNVLTQSPTEDETIKYVAEDIEQNTKDFVIKTISRELKGHALADFVAHLLGTMGYQTRVSPPGPDGGLDIVAHKDELGFVPPIIKVQVKSSEGSVGDPVVSQLMANLNMENMVC